MADRSQSPDAGVRPILPIRLVALDIDGTLVGDDLVLGERTVAAVRAVVGRGVHVSIATGRMPSSAMRFALPLGLVDPIVSYQGGLIRAMPATAAGQPRGAHGRASGERIGRLLVHTPLPAAVARDAVAWCRARGLDPHVNHLERFVIQADDPWIEDYSSFAGSRVEVVDDLLEWLRHPVTKVIAVGREPAPERALDEARRIFDGRATATISHPRYLEFVAPGVTKGRAVRWLARRFRVPLGAVLAIGDQLNDLEMLVGVGHGAAMPSAPAAVLAAARYLAPPVEAEGVAQVLELLVLGSDDSALRAAEGLAAAARHGTPVDAGQPDEALSA